MAADFIVDVLVVEESTDVLVTATGPPGPGVTWRGPWSAGFNYEIGDAVSYLGSSYLCFVAHINHVPPNLTYWGLLAQAAVAWTWQGVYDPAVTYVPQDVVDYFGTAYLALLGSTGVTPPSDPTTWAVLAQGTLWRGAWDSATTYAPDDAVSYLGGSYIAINTNVADPPPSANWNILATPGAAVDTATTFLKWGGL